MFPIDIGQFNDSVTQYNSEAYLNTTPRPDETHLRGRFKPKGMDPIVIAGVGLILLFVFFIYLLLRRTVQGFREGVDQGRK